MGARRSRCQTCGLHAQKHSCLVRNIHHAHQGTKTCRICTRARAINRADEPARIRINLPTLTGGAFFVTLRHFVPQGYFSQVASIPGLTAGVFASEKLKICATLKGGVILFNLLIYILSKRRKNEHWIPLRTTPNHIDKLTPGKFFHNAPRVTKRFILKSVEI